MNAELLDAICLFRHDQELALNYVHHELRIPVPLTARHWVRNSQEIVASVRIEATRDGVTFRAHGYGIEISHPDFRIDYDYGPAGQCECFDEWRLSLHRHLRLGLRGPVVDPRPLEIWLSDAVESGELIRVTDSQSLLCDPTLPSKWSPSADDAE